VSAGSSRRSTSPADTAFCRTSRLVVPSVRLSTVGSRAFPVVAPRIWNALPEETKEIKIKKLGWNVFGGDDVSSVVDVIPSASQDMALQPIVSRSHSDLSSTDCQTALCNSFNLEVAVLITSSQPLTLLVAAAVYDLPTGTVSLCLAVDSARTAVVLSTMPARQSGTRYLMNLEILTVLIVYGS